MDICSKSRVPFSVRIFPSAFLQGTFSCVFTTRISFLEGGASIMKSRLESFRFRSVFVFPKWYAPGNLVSFHFRHPADVALR